MRELEEARARAAQMEKTMRWWSDCTANWREKWSKVRTERNKAREEVRLLRTKLEMAAKEIDGLKREKQDLESEVDKTKRGVACKARSRDHSHDSSGSGPCSIHSVPERDVPTLKGPPEKPTTESRMSYPIGLLTVEERDFGSLVQQEKDRAALLSAPHPSPNMEFFDAILKSSTDPVSKSDSALEKNLSSMQRIEKESRKKINQELLWEEMASPDVEYMEQRVSELRLRLDEASKTILAEREEKASLHKNFERLQHEHNELKMKYEELKVSKHECEKELSQLKAEHQDEIDSIRLDLEDEANNRSSMDRRLGDLRAQLERLQVENAAEWGKRERLETEKLTLEREIKKYRTQIEDLEERLERKAKSCSNGGEMNIKVLQHELYEKNKELADLKYSHTKLKKVLQDKTTELAHAIRRAEQYETEVKKLRSRVEELKKELATAEDEVDSSTNNLRKLQRTNDELQEQIDSLQVQVDHLQTRVRNNSHSLLALRGSNSLLNDGLSEDDNAEF